MLPQNLNDAREPQLQELLGTSEGQRVDFKLTLPLARDPGAKTEFLKDVSAFANGGGGDLVYGVRDENARQAPFAMSELTHDLVLALLRACG